MCPLIPADMYLFYSTQVHTHTCTNTHIYYDIPSFSLSFYGTVFHFNWASLEAQTVKNLPAHAEDPDSIPELGRSPGEGEGYPLQYSGLGTSMDCIVLGDWTERLRTVHGVTELDMTERLSLTSWFTGFTVFITFQPILYDSQALWLHSFGPSCSFLRKLRKVECGTNNRNAKEKRDKGAFWKHLWPYMLQLSRYVLSDSLWPHELQHARPPCPSPAPGVHSNSHPSSRWYHPAISSSVVPFFSCPQSASAQGSFPMSWLFASGDQSFGASVSASGLPKNTQDWSPLEWTGWMSLQSKRLSRVFSNTTVKNHKFFGAQLFYSPTLTSIHDHRKNHSLN